MPERKESLIETAAADDKLLHNNKTTVIGTPLKAYGISAPAGRTPANSFQNQNDSSELFAHRV